MFNDALDAMRGANLPMKIIILILWLVAATLAGCWCLWGKPKSDTKKAAAATYSGPVSTYSAPAGTIHVHNENRSPDRALTIQQIARLREALRPLSKTKVSIFWNTNNQEAQWLAKRLAEAMKDAGFESPAESPVSGLSDVGVTIASDEENVAKWEPIAGLLVDFGIITNPKTASGADVRIIVGSRP